VPITHQKDIDHRRRRDMTKATRQTTRLGVLLVTLIAVLVLLMTDDARASSGTSFADTDGHIPIYSVCYSGYDYGAYYSWDSDSYGNISGAIYVDDCLLADYGAGSYDRERIIAHEWGHATGLPHSSDPSSYMYPYYAVTGT
jgi:hypothetical protein